MPIGCRSSIAFFSKQAAPNICRIPLLLPKVNQSVAHRLHSRRWRVAPPSSANARLPAWFISQRPDKKPHWFVSGRHFSTSSSRGILFAISATPQIVLETIRKNPEVLTFVFAPHASLEAIQCLRQHFQQRPSKITLNGYHVDQIDCSNDFLESYQDYEIGLEFSRPAIYNNICFGSFEQDHPRNSDGKLLRVVPAQALSDPEVGGD